LRLSQGTAVVVIGRTGCARTFCSVGFAVTHPTGEDMALSPEIEAQILRYYHAERWRIGTIATQLQVHRDSVARVLAQAGLPALEAVRRPSAIDPYLPFILDTLTQFAYAPPAYTTWSRVAVTRDARIISGT
jgi:hypothetical protein